MCPQVARPGAASAGGGAGVEAAEGPVPVWRGAQTTLPLLLLPDLPVGSCGHWLPAPFLHLLAMGTYLWTLRFEMESNGLNAVKNKSTCHWGCECACWGVRGSIHEGGPLPWWEAEGSGPGRDPHLRAARGAAACLLAQVSWLVLMVSDRGRLAGHTDPSALLRPAAPCSRACPRWKGPLLQRGLLPSLPVVWASGSLLSGELGECPRGFQGKWGAGAAWPSGWGTCAPWAQPDASSGRGGWGGALLGQPGEGREARTRPTTPTRHLPPQPLLTHPLKWAGNARLGMPALRSENHTLFSALPRPLLALASPVASLSATLGGRKWHRSA